MLVKCMLYAMFAYFYIHVCYKYNFDIFLGSTVLNRLEDLNGTHDVKIRDKQIIEDDSLKIASAASQSSNHSKSQSSNFTLVL